MLKLTHNDYFTTSGTGSNWTINFKKCTKKILQDYHAELLDAAKIIYENTNDKLVLLLSGGLDSEFMLNIFKTANIPFEVAIISYGFYNQHDTNYAFEYCKNHNIRPQVVDIDIDNFIKTGKIYDIAQQTGCNAYQMTSIMYGVSKLDGTLIMANGEPYVKNYDSIWKYQETEHVNSYMKWYTDNGINGTPDFLRYTPESTVAFLKEPRVQELIDNYHPGKLSTRTSKHLIYSKNYTFLPRKKYTGWERIEQTNIFIHEVSKEFNKLKQQNNGVYEIEVSKLLRLLI